MTRDQLTLPAAVLWDMDGTLIDTEPYWMAVETDLIAEAGGTWTHEDAVELVGNSLLRSAEIILARTPVTGTPHEVVEILLAGVVARTRERMPWRPGARELLEDCAGLGVPCALVTMSWAPLAEVLLESVPAGTFAAVVTGDQVVHGKPSPDAYLLAAERLGVTPADCIAVEDSPTGVRSATAAGVPTIAVPHVVPVPEVPGMVTVPGLEGKRLGDLMTLTQPLRGHH
ncbi:HAD family phosphatase [Ornithinimicrobium faecis]|uniref:HAD family phosphatase n=1 Tax=Ornithinimicrobium faecis TaxID=2934158 RepID=A0ABY4YN52_9MICO|nr:HAD family phosphatase [Ornithinimicrobium sp. HY1793]USQ78220.1 HAD family phosphatase [Ornithinimicrobium sp. HY1793]